MSSKRCGFGSQNTSCLGEMVRWDDFSGVLQLALLRMRKPCSLTDTDIGSMIVERQDGAGAVAKSFCLIHKQMQREKKTEGWPDF